MKFLTAISAIVMCSIPTAEASVTEYSQQFNASNSIHYSIESAAPTISFQPLSVEMSLAPNGVPATPIDLPDQVIEYRPNSLPLKTFKIVETARISAISLPPNLGSLGIMTTSAAPIIIPGPGQTIGSFSRDDLGLNITGLPLASSIQLTIDWSIIGETDSMFGTKVVTASGPQFGFYDRIELADFPSSGPLLGNFGINYKFFGTELFSGHIDGRSVSFFEPLNIAVHIDADGKVAVVPLPNSALLFISLLGGLGAVCSRTRKIATS